jgi:hypothetical protein
MKCDWRRLEVFNDHGERMHDMQRVLSHTSTSVHVGFRINGGAKGVKKATKKQSQKRSMKKQEHK